MNRATLARAAAAAAIVTAAMLASSAGVASANHGAPVVQACVGTSLSAGATTLPPGDFGAAIVSFAQAPGTWHPGLGDGIQELKAGLVPDGVVPNTCND